MCVKLRVIWKVNLLGGGDVVYSTNRNPHMHHLAVRSLFTYCVECSCKEYFIIPMQGICSVIFHKYIPYTYSATYFPCVPSQFPNRMYPRPGYPAHSPAQPSGGPPTPTYSPHQAPPIAPPTVGPPPYGTAGQPSTPTDSGYFGSVPNMHHMSGPVPSPLSKGVSGTVYILQCVMLVVRSVFC